MEFLLSLVALVLVIVVITGALRRPGKDNMKRISDGYFYFMAFVALMVMYWGAADLIRVILEKWWIGGVSQVTSNYYYNSTSPRFSGSSYAYEQWLRGVSLRVSALLVAVPIWYFHWHKATSRPKEEIDVTGKRAYTFAIVLVMGLSSIGMMIGALYLGMNAMLGISLSDNEIRSLTYLLPYSVGALALWTSHWKVWHRSREEELAAVKMQQEAVSAPVSAEVKS